ncbi:hypothetical protein ACOI8O_02365 [Bifidobacterium adolescentis]|uniref:hypothetical protein n=1 Tax=Bifidobacterium adolescentis TaxID=1680 RepID=UPI003D03C26C
MTMNLITGKAGAPHITSSDQGAIQAGLVGNGNYLLQGGDGKFPAVTMQSANKALVPVLNLVIEGRYARVTAAETVTIESGVTGRNRNDLICVKYTRDSNNIETIALAVLKGTATSGTAADPTVPSGSILNNSGTVWIPIARIPISGITAGTPVMLVKQLPPMSQLWDSVTLIWKVPYSADGIVLSRTGDIVTVNGNVKFNQSGQNDYSTMNETIPIEYRPSNDVGRSVIAFPQCAFSLLVYQDGTVQALGNPNSAYSTAHGCWMAMQ